jgi:hypothetical protein
VDSARELVDVQFRQPQELLKKVVDLMVDGVAARLAETKVSRGRRRRTN